MPRPPQAHLAPHLLTRCHKATGTAPAPAGFHSGTALLPNPTGSPVFNSGDRGALDPGPSQTELLPMSSSSTPATRCRLPGVTEASPLLPDISPHPLLSTWNGLCPPCSPAHPLHVVLSLPHVQHLRKSCHCTRNKRLYFVSVHSPPSISVWQILSSCGVSLAWLRTSPQQTTQPIRKVPRSTASALDARKSSGRKDKCDGTTPRDQSLPVHLHGGEHGQKRREVPPALLMASRG